MWRDRIITLCPSAEFASPSSHTALAAVELAVSVALPADLRALLLESDGVLAEHGLALVWPAARIRDDNLLFRRNPEFRDLYMPFDSLLFFADAGNGDQFAFTILAGAITRPDIFAWDHENDSRTWVAPSFERYIEWWLSGRITL